MERGDIGDFSVPGQACVFEGLLASPPASRIDRVREQYHMRRGDWEAVVTMWVPHELAVKSLIDTVKRLGISTEVITFLDAGAVEPIYQWLVRKGLVTTVRYYERPEAFAEDLKYDWSIRNVFCADQEVAAILGMRATVVSPKTTWSA
jgi:hypothetical protein